MIAWPSVFPSATLSGYSLSPAESVVRTNMDSGIARQRQQFTAVPTRVKLRWIMAYDIFGLFESWYQNKAKSGAEWVQIPLMGALGYENKESRFIGPYTAKLLSDKLWEITADIEIKRQGALSESALDLVLSGGVSPDRLSSQALFLHDLINMSIPTVRRW
jgi:hypothetical protein